MLIDKCPHCDVSHVQTKQLYIECLKAGDRSMWWRIIRCQNPECNRMILVVCSEQGDVHRIYPVGTYELESNVSISQEIRDDFREAGLSLGAGCYKASMVMSRRVLQRCLKEQGCKQHKLVDAIDHALQQKILRNSFHSIATEIRQYGNLGAHPDDDQLTNATRENAELILDFVRLLIHDLYEVPAAASKLKQNRQT